MKENSSGSLWKRLARHPTNAPENTNKNCYKMMDGKATNGVAPKSYTIFHTVTRFLIKISIFKIIFQKATDGISLYVAFYL